MATPAPLQFNMRISPEDLAYIEAIQAKTGIANKADVFRLALRRLAETEGVQPNLKKKR